MYFSPVVPSIETVVVCSIDIYIDRYRYIIYIPYNYKIYIKLFINVCNNAFGELTKHRIRHTFSVTEKNSDLLNNIKHTTYY